jgi:predicted Fe-Mo cluster-binding NifX family protein
MANRTRVAVSAEDPRGLESVVSPHFGRCPYYVLVDLDERQVECVEAVENPYYAAHQPGQVPRFIHSQGADVMLAGGMGRRAIGLFQEYRIEAVTGASGTVRHALEQYLHGALQGAAPCRESTEHAHDDSPAGDEYEEDEVGRLREEADMLRQQLDDVVARLNQLS